MKASLHARMYYHNQENEGRLLLNLADFAVWKAQSLEVVTLGPSVLTPFSVLKLGLYKISKPNTEGYREVKDPDLPTSISRSWVIYLLVEESHTPKDVRRQQGWSLKSARLWLHLPGKVE